MVVEWTFRENGAERIDTVLFKEDICKLEMRFKVIYRPKRAVISKNILIEYRRPTLWKKPTPKTQYIDKNDP